MRTMKRIMKGMALAAVCVLALSGCVREVMDEEAGVVKIAFSASPTATRTEFQNPVSPSGITKEHVYWRNGDAVAVCSDLAANQAGTSHNAVYTVSASSENLTEVPATSADGLRWADKTSVHKFFAVYGSGATVNMTKMVGTMPAAQTLTWNEAKTVGKAPMAYAFMVSTKESVKVDALEMKFNQMYTAFQFTVGSGDNDAVSLTSFTLSSTSAALAGGFEVDYNATTPTAISRATDAEPTKSITVTFPKTGNADFQVGKNAPVTFTVLALAQPLETMTNLSIEFTGPVIGTRKLDLKNNKNKFIEFAPGTKHIINGLSFPNLLTATGEDIIWEQTAVGEEIAWQNNDYVLGRVNPYDLTYLGGTSVTGRVISYNKATGNPVAWTVLGYYPTEADAQADRNKYEDLAAVGWIRENGYPESGAGSRDGQVVTINYNGPANTEVVTQTVGPEVINAEIKASTFGLDSSPDCHFNLANPSDKLSDEIVESANSYVINGPGYYRIPLVMGNGVKSIGEKKSMLNTASYTKVSGSGAKDFKNHANEVVNSPLLHKSHGNYTPDGAYVVWTTTSGLIEIDATPITMTAGIVGNSLNDNKDDVYWLNFHIDKSKAEQGNAIIAVTSNNTVIWSYHIWVTNYVCRNEEGSEDVAVNLNPNRLSGAVYKLMPLNLGWLYEGNNIRAEKYPEASMYVRIKQAESGKIAIMEVKRPVHHVVTKYDLGRSPFYQWGRKDPFMPNDDGVPYGVTNGAGNNQYYSATQRGSGSNIKFGQAIQNPNVFYTVDTGGTYPWTSDLPASNVWSATSGLLTTTNQSSQEVRNYTVVKTIYDPCPAGYSVPNYGALSFRPNDETTNGTAKYNTSWTEASIPYGSGGGYTLTNGIEDLKIILGIEDGLEPNSFYGFNFYADMTFTRSGSNFTYNLGDGSSIYIPAHGFISYASGELQRIDTNLSSNDGYRGYYWSALAQNTTQAYGFACMHYWSNSTKIHTINSSNWHHFPVSDGCYIRPMQNDN